MVANLPHYLMTLQYGPEIQKKVQLPSNIAMIDMCLTHPKT